MQSLRPVFRFAPSPNGELHLGHALSALTGFAMAQRVGGRFLVRIEDIDLARCSEAHVEWILEDLAWLGLAWEEPVLRQSQRFPLYREAADRLEALGVLYPCFASRTEIADAAARAGIGTDPEGAPLYPGISKGLSATEIGERHRAALPYALRLDMAKAIGVARETLGGRALTFSEGGQGSVRLVEARPERWGDVILVRKDVPASYHLAVVVDDAAQGVTDVTRGMDLFAATDVHRLLQVLLDLPEPRYHHHALITDDTGRKLAKSARDVSLRSLRVDGVSAAEIRARLGFS